MINVQRQYYTRVKWKLVKASLWDRFKFKITFGLFGRMEWLDRSEEDVVVYLPIIDNRVSYASMINGGSPLFNSGFVSNAIKHVNCRCGGVEVNNGRNV